MQRTTRKSLVFFTLLIVIMLSSVLIFPQLVFANGASCSINVTATNENENTLFNVSATGLPIELPPLHYIYRSLALYRNGESIPSTYYGTDFPAGSGTDNYNDSYLLQAGSYEAVITYEVYYYYEGVEDWEDVICSDTEYFTVASAQKISVIKPEPKAWVRDHEMTCKQVWINEENKFQFSFIYPYADNNWVKIYDMSGNEVYSFDMPYDNPNIIVDLPDGMYTVKTFHDQPEPLQTFIIGKP